MTTCTYEGCGADAAPGTLLTMCDTHAGKAQALLHKQLDADRNARKHPSQPWWKTSRRQTLSRDDLATIDRVIGRLTEDEIANLKKGQPALPKPISRRKALGLGDHKWVFYIAPKLVAYLRGEFDLETPPVQVPQCGHCGRPDTVCECYRVTPGAPKMPITRAEYLACCHVLANLHPNEIGRLLGPTAPHFPQAARMTHVIAQRVDPSILVTVARGEYTITKEAA